MRTRRTVSRRFPDASSCVAPHDGGAVLGLAAILAACGWTTAGAAPGEAAPRPAGLQPARPDNPVTLPSPTTTRAIADGLSPEAGPLKIFGYNDYVWKKVRNQFGDRYSVDVEYTVFDTPDEMVAKLQSNGSDFDVSSRSRSRTSASWRTAG